MTAKAEHGRQSERSLAGVQRAFGRGFRAFLIDSGCRLEIDLTLCRINAHAISNRRKSANYTLHPLNRHFNFGIQCNLTP
jgi:hypothetical protein